MSSQGSARPHHFESKQSTAFSALQRIDSVIDHGYHDQSPIFRLLDLPSELFLHVTESMSPASQILTSFTCKLLYSLLHGPAIKRIKELSFYEQLDFSSAMLDSSSNWDKFACPACRRLHWVQSHDVPGVGWLGVNYCTAFSANIGNTSKYCLQQRHIQLTLRYARKGLCKDHLARLLRPYHDSDYTSINPLTVETVAQPAIIDGRYLLHLTERFRSTLSGQLTIGLLQLLKICPHLARTSPSEAVKNPLRQVLEDIFDGGETLVHGACGWCPTDYTLQLFEDFLQMEVWYDFGSDGSPNSPYWFSRIHEPNDGSLRQQSIVHEPGSVRNRYNRVML
jgi:hypothetical protein